MDEDVNNNTSDTHDSEACKGSLSLKRSISGDESSPRNRRVLSVYKHLKTFRSPKTPKKVRPRKFCCANILCKVQFSTKRAKLHHERFQCPHVSGVGTNSSTTSSDN